MRGEGMDRAIEIAAKIIYAILVIGLALGLGYAWSLTGAEWSDAASLLTGIVVGFAGVIGYIVIWT